MHRFLLALILLTPLAATAGEYGPPAPVSVAAEIVALRKDFAAEVPRAISRAPARDAELIGAAQQSAAAAKWVPDHPQLLVIVDRNPAHQDLVVVMARPGADWIVIGGTKVSTGSTGRFDHYITPAGVFHNSDAILGFRAQGTLNENGIRGYGAKGMRIWDFGWQTALKGWTDPPTKGDRTTIRMMMHATDADHLEQRIGRPASQGCIRIPTAMNHFLDRHGIIDADYERMALTDIRFRTLLLPERTPAQYAGDTLIVIDSADPKHPTATPKPDPTHIATTTPTTRS